MAGGIGSRFWPMSRNTLPKQFLDIMGTGKTLIRQTYERFLKICPPENIYIVTNEQYQEHVFAQLPELNKNQVLAEPQRRNTAPCIAYAAFKISQINPDANMVVAPSDHVINDEKNFQEAIRIGLEFTRKHQGLLTIGIQPSRPDTGYGYIQFKEKVEDENFGINEVKTFTEKPNLEMAKFFLKSGEFLWNSGIFLWNSKAILEAFEKNLPDMYTLFQEGKNIYNTSKESEFIRKTYEKCTNISIDYGIMEKAKNVYVLSAELGWSDLGTWTSVYENAEKDEDKNAIKSKHIITYNSKGNIIRFKNNNKAAIIDGLKNYIIVDTEKALLICPRENDQLIKEYIQDLKNFKKGEKFM